MHTAKEKGYCRAHNNWHTRNCIKTLVWRTVEFINRGRIEALQRQRHYWDTQGYRRKCSRFDMYQAKVQNNNNNNNIRIFNQVKRPHSIRKAKMQTQSAPQK